MSEPDYHAEMKLPEGKTCADCVHGAICDDLFGAVRNSFTSCDWWPRKFVEARRNHFQPVEIDTEERINGHA